MLGESTRYAFALLLVCLAAGSMSADEDPLRPVDAVNAVAKAFDAKDATGLARLAAVDDPDPWLVADTLCDRGGYDIAFAFAKASERPATARLSAYVDARRENDAKPGAKAMTQALRSTLTAALELRAAGQGQAALDLLGRPIEGRNSVSGVEVAYLRGRLLDDLTRTVESIPEYERASERALSIGWDRFASESLYQAGRLAHEQAQFERALAAFETHLETEKRLESKMGIGRGHFRVATALEALGRVRESKDHDRVARRLFDESGDVFYAVKLELNDAVEAARQNDVEAAIKRFVDGAARLGDLDLDAYPPRFRPQLRQVVNARVGALTNAMSMALRLGQTRKAKQYARDAVQIARTSPDSRDLDRARALVARIEAAADSADGRVLQALAHLERARSLYDGLGYRDRVADVLRRIGDIRIELGDLPAALACFEEAIGILREAGGVRSRITAHAGAAEACNRMGRGADAEPHYLESVRLARMMENEPELLTDALGSLAAFYRTRAEYSRDRELLNECMRIHEANPGQADVTFTLTQFAYHYAALGDPERALEFADEVLTLRKDSPHAKAVAEARLLRAHMLWHLSRTSEALEEMERVLEINRRGGVQSSIATLLMNVGSLRLARYEEGDAEAALEHFEEAAGLYVAQQDEDQEIIARTQVGRCHAWLGDPEGALEELTYALDRAKEIDNPTLLAQVYGAIAEAHNRSKDYKASINAAYAGARIIANLWLDQAEGDMVIARSRYESVTRWGLASAYQARHPDAMYEFLERSRATALVATLGGRAALREAEVPRALREAEDDARAASAMALEAYAAARRDSAARSELRRLRGELETARETHRLAVAAIQREVRSQADLVYSRPTAPEALQASLGSDEALVLLGDDGWQYVALVLMQKDAKILSLGTVERVEAAVESLVADPSDESALSSVQRLVIDPIRKWGDRKRWHVSPSGVLAYLPFGLVAPERDVCLVPSGTTLQVLRDTESKSGAKVLAVGDPAYEPVSTTTPHPDSSERGSIALTPLPASRKEVEAIGDVVLLGKDASETRLREVVATEPHWRAIHLACHGVLDSVLATRSALALVGDKHNDGRLEASEVAHDVPMSADLVVLSGCETGRGRIRAGEGLQGLSRAFLLAGTPRVLTSLWRVDDKATQALMLKFYELWNPDEGKGVPAAEALRRAQAHVREQPAWKDPKYWAAWVLWGLP